MANRCRVIRRTPLLRVSRRSIQERDLVEDLTVAQESSSATSSAGGDCSTEPACAWRPPKCSCGRTTRASRLTSWFETCVPPASRSCRSHERCRTTFVCSIMDEPSAILDDTEIETMFDVMRRLAADGVGVVYISHRLDEIRRIGDRVTVLSEGATVASGLPASTPADELVMLMVGEELSNPSPIGPCGRRRGVGAGERDHPAP